MVSLSGFKHHLKGPITSKRPTHSTLAQKLLCDTSVYPLSLLFHHSPSTPTPRESNGIPCGSTTPCSCFLLEMCARCSLPSKKHLHYMASFSSQFQLSFHTTAVLWSPFTETLNCIAVFWSPPAKHALSKILTSRTYYQSSYWTANIDR